MVYFSANAVPPAHTAVGPQSYQNPYFKTSCGCGSSNPQITMGPRAGVREGFTLTNNGGAAAVPTMAPAPAIVAPAPAVVAQAAPAGMCTLTATAPPAGCCHPAPLHSDLKI